MRFRLKAFGLHLLASACVLTLILGGLYLGLVSMAGLVPHRRTARAPRLVVSVDLALGPTLTLIIANPKKQRRTLARDIAMIVAVQIAALIYGSRHALAGPAAVLRVLGETGWRRFRRRT